MKFLHKHFSLLVLLLIIAPFAFLHFKSGNFFLTHDGPFHIERTFNLVRSLNDGIFPPAWTRFYNNGFGSPILLYLFPIPYFVSAVIALTGIDLVSVLKLDFLFWDSVAAAGMYLWLRRGLSFSKVAAIVGAIFYLYSPANLSQVFVRGSLREFAGAAIFPAVLLALTQLGKNMTIKHLAFFGLLLGIFFLTDGITVVMFLPIIFLYAGFLFFSSKKKTKFLAGLTASGLIAFLISAYIYLPFVSEMKFLRGPTSYYLEHFVYWWQLFDYHWGFGFSLPGPNDSMSFQLGVINLVTLVFIFLVWLKKRLPFSLLEKLFFAALIGFLVLIIESPLSHFLWHTLSPLQLIQLPWRFLVPTVFVFSFLAASLTNKLNLSEKWALIIFFGVLTISFRYLRTNQIFVFDQNYLSKNSGDATAYHEFIPIWRSTTSGFSDFPQKIEVAAGKSVLTKVSETNNLVTFESTSQSPVVLRTNTLYFPGWRAKVGDVDTSVTITTNVGRPLWEKRDLSGLMSISIPEGKHRVSFWFEDTPIRKVGKVLSVFGLGLAFLLMLLAFV